MITKSKCQILLPSGCKGFASADKRESKVHVITERREEDGQERKLMMCGGVHLPVRRK